jgi:hypothetical protein
VFRKCSPILKNKTFWRNKTLPVDWKSILISYHLLDLKHVSSVTYKLLISNHFPTNLLIRRLTHCLFYYGSTALMGLGSFFSFLIYTQSVELLGWRISPSQGLYLHIEQHKHRQNTDRYSCLDWDSNPRSQCSSERRRYMA